METAGHLRVPDFLANPFSNILYGLCTREIDLVVGDVGGYRCQSQ